MSSLGVFIAGVIPAYVAGLLTREIAISVRRMKGSPMFKNVYRRIDRALHFINSPRFVIPLLGVIAVVACLAWARADFVQNCSARYNEYDSRAREVRTEASTKQNSELRDAFDISAKLMAATTPATDQQRAALRTAISGYVTAYDDYDEAIRKYPYKPYSDFCGGV